MKKKALAGVWTTCALLLLASASARAAEPEIVLHASDAINLQGNWTRVADATAAGGQTMSSADNGWATTAAPLATPVHFFEFTFNAAANTPYQIWVRLRATANSKYNDAAYAQLSDAVDGSGTP